jgi:hypothetical protein
LVFSPRFRKEVLREIHGSLSEFFEATWGNMARCRQHDRREAHCGYGGQVRKLLLRPR